MSLLLWSAATATVVLIAYWIVRQVSGVSRSRRLVLEEVCRKLRGGVIENLSGRGPQARGRLGELEVTVDLLRDSQTHRETPRWRVMAVGPVRLDAPIEAHVDGWREWIDPWLQMARTLSVPGGVGQEFTVHAEEALTLDHPVVVALRRQGPALGPGALHVQHDFMRAEVRFFPDPEKNLGLFGFLQAMAEISNREPARSLPRNLRIGIQRAVR